MHTIYTYGYLAGTRDHLAVLVEEHGARLVDIRYSPTSRHPHWRSLALKDVFGDRYVWVQSFGNRNYQGGPIVLVNVEFGLALVAPVLHGRSIILLCACKEAARCHRSVVADLLAARTGAPVVHLEGKR